MTIPESETGGRRPGAILHTFIVVLTVVLVGVAVYLLLHAAQPLTRSEAANAVGQILEAQGPITTVFHTGLIKDRIDESASDPEYRLLERAAIIKVVRKGNSAAHVGLTAKGAELLKQTVGVRHWNEPDGLEAYEVPLAGMRLQDISTIRMAGRGHAVVNFTWRWSPNKFGEFFDASNGVMRELTTGERSAMIEFYGARFYQQAPTSAAVSLVKSENGWELEK